MKKKNIFNSLIFWKSLLVLIVVAFYGGFSCMLIFYFKIFEKWDKAYVHKVEDYNGNTAIVYYLVDNVEYRNRVSVESSVDQMWFNKRKEDNLYVDYLVSDPNFFFPDRRVGLIPCSIAEAALILGGIIYIVQRTRKPKEKQNERK